MNYRKQSLRFLSDKKGSTVIDWLRIQLFLRFFINIIIFLYDIFSAVYMFLNQCGYPVTETGCHQIKRCLRTSQLPRFMLPSDMMMSTDIQFTNSSVSALDICLMRFGDARTMSARIADQADYGPLIPARIAARIHYVSPRPARGIDGFYRGFDSFTGIHLGGSFKEISVLLWKYWFQWLYSIIPWYWAYPTSGYIYIDMYISMWMLEFTLIQCSLHIQFMIIIIFTVGVSMFRHCLRTLFWSTHTFNVLRPPGRRRTKETTRAIILAPDPPPKCRNSP